MAIILTPKQIEATLLMGRNTTTLLEGGSRSGKSLLIIRNMIIRAIHYPNTWHLAARLRLNHARTSLWKKTIPDCVRLLGIQDKVQFNHSDLILLLPNNSRLLVGGLDNKDRVEKILGNEYATIFLNEASQLDYNTYEIVTTRGNPPQGVPFRFWIDYNPPPKQHWGYKIFHERKFPDGRPVPDGDYACLKINPYDNTEHIADDYLQRLQNLSGNKRLRFLEGEYTTEEGSLWKRAWIKYGLAPGDLARIVIGVDPSGSKDGDEIGIIVAGISRDGQLYILADYSLHGTPEEWSAEVAAAYSRYNADVVVAEKNYGGEMVEAVITQMGKNSINVKLVNASRGKTVRAEPISAMYERGQVIHAEQFPELEDEMCTFKQGESDSPNRMDACVWALTALTSETDAYIV